MNNFLNGLKRRFSAEPYFWLALSLGILTTSIALVLYAYLGTFSRYGSDDYCNSSFFLSGDLVSQMINRYLYMTNRYSNILFIGVAERIFGWYNVAILPSVMIILFVIGTYKFFDKIKELAVVKLESRIVLFISVSLVFFSLLQAPNLHETLYWRAAMATHFAPLVFMLFLGTFLFNQIRSLENRPLARRAGLTCLIASFLVGGFSEPPTAMMITILSLAIFAIWIWGKDQSHRRIIAILLWSLAGALMALVVIASSPSFSNYPQKPHPGFSELILDIVRYPFEFVVDTLRTLPLPTLMSIITPAVLFFVIYTNTSPMGSTTNRVKLGIVLFVVPLIAYLLIAASFAPSAYGNSYPIGRARFTGRWLMTSVLMVDGALLGILVASIRMKFLQSAFLRRFAIFILMLLVLYPLRGAWRVSTEIPEYRQRAAAWDLRDSEIRALRAQGAQDLVVRFLPDEKIQDLGDHTGFRLNRCASIIYGVDTIVAVPMDEE